jgi:holo-ACP synthase
MPLYLTSATHAVITLPQLIASRDARQARQQEWLDHHAITLISFTVVAPGPVKDSELTRRIFNHGLRALRQLAAQSHWEIKKQICLPLPTGAEGLLAIDAPAYQVKRMAMELEQTHPLGRLWDIDVLEPHGKILSRADFDQPPRNCLICQRPAAVCAREQTHSLADLVAHMEAMLHAANNAPHN